jgi:hypothetical protein
MSGYNPVSNLAGTKAGYRRMRSLTKPKPVIRNKVLFKKNYFQVRLGQINLYFRSVKATKQSAYFNVKLQLS